MILRLLFILNPVNPDSENNTPSNHLVVSTNQLPLSRIIEELRLLPFYILGARLKRHEKARWRKIQIDDDS